MAKVLVIDDESEIRRLIRKVLQKLGHEVIESSDGFGASDFIRRDHPALVLLDMHMPRLDGLAALSEILETDPSAVVVMVTGDCDMDRAKLALERGARDYLTKPFDMAALEAVVIANLCIRGPLE